MDAQECWVRTAERNELTGEAIGTVFKADIRTDIDAVLRWDTVASGAVAVFSTGAPESTRGLLAIDFFLDFGGIWSCEDVVEPGG